MLRFVKHTRNLLNPKFQASNSKYLEFPLTQLFREWIFLFLLLTEAKLRFYNMFSLFSGPAVGFNNIVKGRILDNRMPFHCFPDNLGYFDK